MCTESRQLLGVVNCRPPSPGAPQKDPNEERSLHLPSWKGPHQGEDQRQLLEDTKAALGGPLCPKRLLN